MDFWQYELVPDGASPTITEVGWYPVLICYDMEKGAFPSASQWNGQSWERGPVFAFGPRQADAETAERLAHDNDPDM